MLQHKRVAVVGAGRLGETLIKALVDSGAVTRERITASARHDATIDRVHRLYGVRATLDNAAAVQDADLAILSVKPQVMPEVLRSVRGALRRGAVVVSTAAGVPTIDLARGLKPGTAVVRSMPNTPCHLQAGMTAICGGGHAREEHLALAKALFDSMGRTLVLDERHFDAVTGMSGSGPAYFYLVLEAVIEGGIKVGLPREVATELAAQTMFGAARMVLGTREHPARLRDMVTTPAGCTIDGLMELEAGGVRVSMIKAVVQATRRAAELRGHAPAAGNGRTNGRTVASSIR